MKNGRMVTGRGQQRAIAREGSTLMVFKCVYSTLYNTSKDESTSDKSCGSALIPAHCCCLSSHERKTEQIEEEWQQRYSGDSRDGQERVRVARRKQKYAEFGAMYIKPQVTVLGTSR